MQIKDDNKNDWIIKIINIIEIDRLSIDLQYFFYTFQFMNGIMYMYL